MSNSVVHSINVNKWIKENEAQFLPPVCNKLMHNDQLTIMFVGGPNVRKDYHFEEGEELFCQIKGDMCLKVIEQDQHRDIIIKEGEIFLLPAFIPHSPNRFENTVGFVMERKREDNELDCLRYYKDNSTNRLFERWFHTTDLGIQLGPVIKEFFASEEYRTGQPKPNSYIENPPVLNDEKIKLNNPFSLDEWIDKHTDELLQGHSISLFSEKFQTRVYIIPQGQHNIDCSKGDVWLWQHKGRSTAKIIPNNKEESVVNIEQSDSVYLNVHWTCQLNVDKNGFVLAISQDPTRKTMMMELLNNFDCGTNKELSLSSSYNNEQILYRSCLIGDLERVQYLLRSNTSSSSIDLNRQSSDGLTLLHFACSNNFYGLVQLLLQYNATNNTRDNTGRTCLHYASIKGHRAIINLLLENSSSKHEFIYLNDNQNKSSLDYACENDHIELVELFLKSTNMNEINFSSPLYYSCIEGHLDIVHLLISKQQHHERKDLIHFQSSFIQTICDRGHIEILRLLIDSFEQFPISTQQRDGGNSVLFYCITTFDIDLVKQLLERQARLTEKDIHDLISFCPLNDQNHLYIDHYFDCLELLLRYRANFDDQKICKYFIRQLCEKSTTIIIGKKLKYLFALAIYSGSIHLHRRSTVKWCGEINILTKRYVNLIDVIKQTRQNWSLKHLLRLKIKRSMKIFNMEEIKKLPGLKEHHVNFLSFEYL